MIDIDTKEDDSDKPSSISTNSPTNDNTYDRNYYEVVSKKKLRLNSNSNNITKVATGMDWYADDEVSELRKYILTSHLPLLAHTQSIEAAVKDMSICKIPGREERTVSAMSSIRSVFCTLTKENVDGDDKFINRKRTNEESKAYYPGKIFNKNILQSIQTFFPDNIDPIEIKYCQTVLSKANHYQSLRNNELVDLVKTSQINPRPDNANIKITGVQIAPLLTGKIQFGKLGSIHVHHMTNELRLRNVSGDPKLGIRKLTELLKENEHPDWKIRQATMNNEELNDLKFFYPRYLTAED